MLVLFFAMTMNAGIYTTHCNTPAASLVNPYLHYLKERRNTPRLTKSTEN